MTETVHTSRPNVAGESVDEDSTLLRDLHEDLATRWIPDPVADADAGDQIARPSLTLGDAPHVEVPREVGGPRVVAQLSVSALSYIRRAVADLRHISDAALHPSVCGYRLGADGDTRYDAEYRRFGEMSQAIGEHSNFILRLDIQDFFASVSGPRVKDAMSSLWGDAWEPISGLFDALERSGVRGLPPGYADARLIGNAILTHVDQAIPVEFTRWVDDYRISVHSPDEGRKIMGVIERTLEQLGLKLNARKTSLIPRRLHPQRSKIWLDSVYHPEYEAPAVVRANLRRVFADATQHGDRRRLRFVLPRLANERDPVAVTYCITQIMAGNVDAPRMVYYLSHFSDAREIGEFVENGLYALNSWSLGRVLPLLVGRSLGPAIRRYLLDVVRSGVSEPVKSLAARVLSISGDWEGSLSILHHGIDPRTAVAVSSDLGIDLPPQYEGLAVATSEAARRLGRLPAPTAKTIL